MAIWRDLLSGQERPLRKVTLIGREPACDIVLDNVEVSDGTPSSSCRAAVISSKTWAASTARSSTVNVPINASACSAAIRFASRASSPILSPTFPLRRRTRPRLKPAQRFRTLITHRSVRVWTPAKRSRFEINPEKKLEAILEIWPNLTTSLDLDQIFPQDSRKPFRHLSARRRRFCAVARSAQRPVNTQGQPLSTVATGGQTSPSAEPSLKTSLRQVRPC